jgi:hypothetical protein
MGTEAQGQDWKFLLIIAVLVGTSALLAKYRGRDPLKFGFLGILFWMVVIPYLCLVKTKTKGVRVGRKTGVSRKEIRD